MLHAGVSRHHQASLKPDLFHTVITGDMDFWVGLGNQVSEQSVAMSDIDHLAFFCLDKVKSQCSSCSSMWGTSQTVSSCYRARQSISKSTSRSYSVCFAWCSRTRVVAEQTVAAHNTLASGSSCPRWTLSYWNTLPLHLILLCVTFFFSPSSRRWSRGPILKV